MTRPWSIRSRLTALFVLASIAVVAAVSVLLLRDQQSSSTTRLDRRLLARIDAIELALRKNGRFPYSELYGEVVDPNYQIVGMSQSIDLPGLLSQSQIDFVFQNGSLRVTTEDGHFGGTARFVAQRRTIGAKQYVIVVGEGENSLRSAHHRLLFALAFGGPGLVLLSGLGGWLLAGGVLRSVRDLTDDADAISRFDASARLEVPARDDEIRHLAMTLNAMLERLEQTYRRERSFVDDASHELRTPLALLRGELELASLDAEAGSPNASALIRCIEEVDRLSEMTDDLLVLARTGQSATVTEPLAVDDELERIVARLRPSVGSLQLSVDCSTPGRIALRADQFERMLRNLVDNAARFSTTRIDVIAHDVDGGAAVAITVRDDGPGFPASFLPHAFERFRVAEESRTRSAGSGTGLGLAIVAALADGGGGRVEAANAVPHGAVVTVTLPVV